MSDNGSSRLALASVAKTHQRCLRPTKAAFASAQTASSVALASPRAATIPDIASEITLYRDSVRCRTGSVGTAITEPRDPARRSGCGPRPRSCR